MQGKTWTKSTAGSTGEPLQLDYNPDSYDWRWAVARRGYAWAGHEEGMRQVSIWGLFTMGERKIYREIKEKLHHRMQGRLIVNALKLDERNMPQAVEVINDYDPSRSSATRIRFTCLRNISVKHGGFRVRPKGVISAAEKLFEYQRPVIEQAFGCQSLRNIRQPRSDADLGRVRTRQWPASEHRKSVRRNPQGGRYARRHRASPARWSSAISTTTGCHSFGIGWAIWQLRQMAYARADVAFRSCKKSSAVPST